MKAYIGLGSNLGDRHRCLCGAVRMMRQDLDVQIIRISSVYETEPVDCTGGLFLNAVAEIETRLSANLLLKRLLAVEDQWGRKRSKPSAERSIDLDLLMYGNEISQSQEFIVPHPRMHERLFVLEPLSELEPGLIHPVLHRSVSELKDQLPYTGGIRKTEYQLILEQNYVSQ